MSEDIAITVRLFASLRDAAGTGRIDAARCRRRPRSAPCGATSPTPVRALGLPEGCATRSTTSGALPGAPLRDGDEVALVLPVSGG